MIAADKILFLMSFMISIFSGIFCILIILLKLIKEKHEKPVKPLLLILIALYLLSVFYSISLFTFHLYPSFSENLRLLYLTSIILFPVIFFQFICGITMLSTPKKHINGIYYLLALFLIITAFFTDQNSHTEKSKVSLYFTAIYYCTYLFLSIKRIIDYKKNINDFSSNLEISSLKWLINILGLFMVLFPLKILFHYLPDGNIYRTFWGLILPNYILLIFYIVLCYNVFRKNFTFNDSIESKDTGPYDGIIKINLNRKLFEKYIKENKPYLDPYLKITDIITPLGTNRTYLSSFINKTYGMNFSTYINTLRFEEFLTLKQLPENRQIPEEELLYNSGFRSINSYNRMKIELEQKMNPFPENTD